MSAASAPAAASLGARLDLPALAGIVGLYALSRAALMLVGVLTLTTIDDSVHRGMGGALAQLWCRWDCGWYLAIVEHGYSAASGPEQPGATSLAFFPVLPLLVRWLSQATGLGTLGAGLVISNLAFLAALVYVHRYALLLGASRTTAMLAVALLCLVPHGFVFSAVYTESLFLLLLAASMYHLRRGQYLRAGLAAAVLSATRATGVLFLVFALAHIARRHGAGLLLRPWRNPAPFIPVLLAPLGLFLWWAWCFRFTGDAFAQASTVGHGWGWQSGWFLDNLWSHLHGGVEARFWAIASLVVFACATLLLRLRLYEEFALCAAIALLLWSGQVPNSLLRYFIVLFPAWIALAWHLDRRPVAIAAVFATLALVNGYLMSAWTLGKPISI
jgi:hypothetical protein